MLKKLLLAALLFTAIIPAQAEPPVPKASSGGDYWIYNEDTWLDWEVITKELVGRITPAWPENEQSPDALLKIDWLVPQWPVVARYPMGSRLRAVPDDCGGILIKDIDGGSWMKVEAPTGGFCFVRANSKYIKPVRVAPQAVVAPQPETAPVSPQPEPETVPEQPPSQVRRY